MPLIAVGILGIGAGYLLGMKTERLAIYAGAGALAYYLIKKRGA